MTTLNRKTNVTYKRKTYKVRYRLERGVVTLDKISVDGKVVLFNDMARQKYLYEKVCEEEGIKV